MTSTPTSTRARAGLIPLRVAVGLFLALVAVVAVWTWRSTRQSSDGRQRIVFWAPVWAMGEDIYNVLNRFEQLHPQYEVVLASAVSRDLTSDAQRLLCAVAGDVPPDAVWFDRFAVAEWASRGAFLDLRPQLSAQRSDDPWRIDLNDYYAWTVAEASYAKPGATTAAGVYGIPTSIDIRVLYSNANLLRQEGLVDERGEPRPPRTWEELADYHRRLVRYRDGNAQKGIERLGFSPGSLNGLTGMGNSWLYMYAWQAGGEFLDPTRTRVTLDTPEVVRALRFVTGLCDDVGGIERIKSFQSGFQTGENDPFLKDQLAMRIDGDWALPQTIARYKRDLDFIVSPAPIPADRKAAGAKEPTWAGGWALVIPATAKQKDGAFRLIQYLRSDGVMRQLEAGKREQMQAEGRLYLPAGNSNRAFYEHLVREHVDGNPEVPRRIKEAYGVIKEMLPGTLIRPVTPVGQLLWNKQVEATERAFGHSLRERAKATGVDEYALCLRIAQGEVQTKLDRALAPPPGGEVAWTPFLWLYGALITLPFLAMWLTYRRHRKRFGWRPREVGAGLLFASPWMLGFIVLVGGPILFSLLFSFCRIDLLTPAHWVGLGNFRAAADDPLFWKCLGNTAFMVIRIPLGMALSLAIALLLNRGLRGLGTYRTLFYLPAVTPLVASSLLWWWLFNPQQGPLNLVLDWFFDCPLGEGIEWVVSGVAGHDIEITAPGWLNDQAWSKPALIIMNLWTAGGGMIVWLAGLQSIPQYLYEAAKIDGAGAWARFRNITLPMLSPYVLFNAVMGLIHTMQIFGEAFIMTGGGPENSTLFYAYHLFKQAFQFLEIGYASALAWILFVVVLALTLFQLWLSKRWVHYDQV